MSIEEIIFYSLIAVILFLFFWVLKLEIKIKKIPSVKINSELSKRIDTTEKKIDEINSFIKKTNTHFQIIDTELKKSIKGIEILRFNPFKKEGIGGNQSFATALTDSHGNGIIISSLYSRERVSIFAKPIKNWGCEYEMSEEEKLVLDKTKNNQS